MNIEIPDDLYQQFRQVVEKRAGRQTVENYVQRLIQHEISKYPPPDYHEADSLTRCKTRNQLNSEIHYAVLRMKQGDIFSKRYLCVDIDNFMSSLDFYGLTAGDQVLVELAHQLRKTYPERDVYRFGGDEFVVELNKERYVSFQLSLPVRLKHTIVEVEVPSNRERHHHVTRAILVLIDRGMVEARPEGNVLVYRGDDLSQN